MRQLGPPRVLSVAQSRRMAGLRRIARLLDSAVAVPGTSYRVGLDPILGLIPGLGDVVSPIFAIGILWNAYDLRLPRVVQARMVFNVAIDAVLGVVPLIGDLFDFVWKANDRNMALLEQHAAEERRSSAGDWMFVVGMTVLIVVLAAVPFIIAGWLLVLLGRSLL